MKTKVVLLALFISFIGYSQSFIGFTSDNYSGINSVISNPANIVDSRFRTDINLFGVSGFFDNDYISVKLSELNKDLDTNNAAIKFPSENNNIMVNVNILGPSFMFNIEPKHSLAISTRARTFGNVMEINGNTFDLIDNKLNLEKDLFVKEGDFYLNVNSWAEVGLTYAAVLIDKEEHFLKGGFTAKYLQGLGSVTGNGKNVNVDYDVDGGGIVNGQNLPTITSEGEVNYGYTSNFENKIEKFEFLDDSYGFGGDIGLIYEWRPNVENYKFKNNSGVSQYYKDVNKYKLKFGVSVTDIGSIEYKDAESRTYDITKTITKTDYENIDGTKNKLDQLYTLEPSKSKNSLTLKLPTALHFDVDWNINSKFYVNLNTNFDISGNTSNGNKISNTYIVTPRYESKWFSAFIPMGMYGLSQDFKAGFGFRAGPLYVGSGSVVSSLIKSETKAIDVYFGLKIPVYQSRPKDKDNDGIFDKVDNCPETSGPAENDGCPWGDDDSDGVLNNVDKCISVAGPSENNGCPWGDKDKDGVTDNIDKCPETAGLKELNGCPDSDGDGVADKYDKCPNVKGDIDNQGCPKDTDGDGVIDVNDQCPNIAGVKENNGCPEVITKEAEKKLAEFAKAIYFNSGKTSFKRGVTQTLDLITNIMNQHPKANFLIEGYTDSVGSEKTNLRLSEKRAKAVLNYLTKKGISNSRLTSYGFGEAYPIDSNKTRAGRANNRRVEIKLKK